MTQYNSLNVKLSNSQLNKLKSSIKNETDVVLRISSSMVGNSNDNTNFSHELLLTNRQVANIRKVFANHSSTDIKLSKTQLSKMIQSGGFLGKHLGPLLKTGLPLVKSVIKPLTRSVLIPSGLTAAAQAADTGIHRKILGFGYNNTTLIISNDEMDDILKIVKSLEDSAVLLKGVSETIQHEAKEQRGGFLSILLGTLGASLLGDVLSKGLSGSGVIRAGEGTIRAGEGTIRAGKGTIRAGYRSKKGFLKKVLTPLHPLTNFEIQKYYQNEPRFNGVFSRENLPNSIKNGAYIINLDKYHDIGTHWVALYVNNNTIIYFDSFGVEHIPKEIIKFIGNNKKIITNIYRIQAYDSIMCGYFCIGFNNFMFDGNSLTDYINLSSPNDF